MSYEFPDYLAKNKEFLNKLARSKSQNRRNKLINQANEDQILAIVEICSNVLKYNFPLKERDRKKLAKFADHYRKIARSRTPKTAKTRIQTGGQIGALAAILAPVVGALAQHILDKTLLNNNTTNTF